MKYEYIKEDLKLLLISATISFIMVFLFDIHWSFYTYPIKLKFIFNSIQPYIFFITIGSIIGFIVLKVLIYLLIEEENIYKNKIIKRAIQKEEIIQDSIIILLSSLISFIIILLLDLHHGFYSWPLKYSKIFQNYRIYLIFISIGSIIGLIVIKAILLTIVEYNRTQKRIKNREGLLLC